MGKNKARHILHGVLDCLPIILIPIFMIYSQNHEINDNTLQVQENKVVDFNEKLQVNDFNVLGTWYQYNSTYSTLTLDDEGANVVVKNNPNGSYLVGIAQNNITSVQNHWYLVNLTYKLSFNSSIRIEFNNNILETQTGIQDTFTLYQGKMQLTNSIRSDKRFLLYPNRPSNDDYYVINNISCFDLTQMFGEGNEPTIEQFNTYFPNSYYPYTESEEVVIENYETITYNDTDIMSQSFYCLYNAVDKYFNMGNVFGMKNLYTWFEVNIFGGTASPSIYIVWNIVLYEFIMDLLFLLYGLFMFFIDLCKRLMEKPLNSIK